MPKGKTKNYKPEERLAQFFLKTVGVQCGLWHSADDRFADDFEEQGVYLSNVSILTSAMKSGWTYDDLHHVIASNYKNGVKAALVSDILPKKEDPIKVEDNLLEEHGEYFHSALYDTTAPRFAVTGSMMIPVSRGSVTRKEQFTLRDLMQYYYDNIKTAAISRRREPDTKTMIWLLKQASLDEILYSIDEASREDVDVPVVELTNYMSDARKEIEYRKARNQ